MEDNSQNPILGTIQTLSVEALLSRTKTTKQQ